MSAGRPKDFSFQRAAKSLKLKVTVRTCCSGAAVCGTATTKAFKQQSHCWGETRAVRVRASTCYLHQVQLNICILWCYYYMQDCSIAKWAGKTPCGANSLIVCVWRSSSLINHPIHPKSIANCALADSPKWKVVALLCVKPKLQNTLSVQDLRLFWYNLIMWSFLIWGSLFLQ